MPRKKKDPDALEERQVDGLRMLARGYDRGDLAARWYVSRDWAAKLVWDAQVKLEAATDAAAVVEALRRGLIELPAVEEMKVRDE